MEQLSDSDLCVLNNLMYDEGVRKQMRMAYDAGESITIGEAIKRASVNSCPREEKYQRIRDYVQSNSFLADVKVGDYNFDEKDGGYSACFVKDNQPYVVFQGTGHDEWYDDAAAWGTVETGQQVAAARYVEYIHNKYGQNVVVTGHSKGGNKAMYATVTTGCVDRCVSFDGEGFSGEFLDYYSDEINKNCGKITSYATEGDFVNVLLNSIVPKENQHYIQSSRIDGDYTNNHQAFSLLDENMELGKWGERSPAAEQIHAFTVWADKNLSAEDKDKVGDLLGYVLESAMGGGKYRGEEVDFVKLINENPEAWGIFLAALQEYGGTDDLLFALAAEILGPNAVEGLVDTDKTDSAIDRIVFLITSMAARGITGAGIMLLLMALGLLDTFSFGLSTDLIKAKIREMLIEAGVDLEAIDEMFEHAEKARNRIRTGENGSNTSGSFSSNEIHDFREETRRMLLGLIDEINSEPFYDVTRWDMWYRAEKWFGRLTPARYQNDMKTYYRKVMDVNDTSKPEIARAFDMAHEADIKVSGQLKEMSRKMQEVATKLKGVWS
ncbi:MAG: DUF2974 domain-containing protein [Atopobiaceae bacterium]|nr:DUF2974 domain-containing protein [Atopobiaceae bacterium]